MSYKDIKFSKEELARYNRHIIIPEFGLVSQQKLKAARVLVVGSGGLGSPLLLYLAAAVLSMRQCVGVGRGGAPSIERGMRVDSRDSQDSY